MKDRDARRKRFAPKGRVEHPPEVLQRLATRPISEAVFLTPADLPCRHRGAFVALVACKPCESRGRDGAEVYSCGVHRRCMMHNFTTVDRGDAATACATCRDRDPVRPPQKARRPLRARRALSGRRLTPPPSGPPEFVTLETLTRDTIALVPKLPPDVSVVVGVARSGMAPASLLAMHLHVPLYSMTRDGIVDCGHGWRLGTGKPHGKDVTAGTALIVDDTVMLGGSLKHARAIAAPHFPRRIHANVYCNPQAKVRPDVFARFLPAPHVLEWNFFNSLYLSYAAFDMDGVLCRDFTREEDDDGPRYLAAMERIEPLHLPRKAPIHIVTARLEQYREPTLAWLAKWDVKVASLTMGPWATQAERNRASVAAWKAGEVRRLFTGMRVIRKFGGPMFVESDPRQAEEIARLSGYLTVCPTSKRCYR